MTGWIPRYHLQSAKGHNNHIKTTGISVQGGVGTSRFWDIELLLKNIPFKLRNATSSVGLHVFFIVDIQYDVLRLWVLLLLWLGRKTFVLHWSRLVAWPRG
jgi:hypothetical protein